MSLSYQRLEPVLVKDPRTELFNPRDYAVLRGGSQVTSKQWTTTSISNSSVQFSCPPPSGGIIVDRKVYLTMPIRLTLSGTVPDGEALLNPAQDAPRAFPVSGSIDTMNVTINNQTVSINLADVIHPLTRFNMDESLIQKEYSRTPSALDPAQAYESLFGGIHNPLTTYDATSQGVVMQRGGFPYVIVSNPVNNSGAPATMTAVVDMVCTEPLFVSPLYFGESNASGFINVTSFDINITFLATAGFRMWSHMAGAGTQTTITSAVAQFSGFSGPAFSFTSNQPIVEFTYITPPTDIIIPQDVPVTYPYFDIQRYPTDLNQSISAGGTARLVSNNIQLSSIPRRVLIFARERNHDLFNTCHNPDTYFAIENLSLQFMNKNGLLASASKGQLYEMAVKNHCNMSWTEWSGGPTQLPDFSASYGTIGGIVALEFATDIGLDPRDAPGKLAQATLQVELTVKNVSGRSINPSLYIIVISEGSFTIEGLGKSSTNIGVLSSEDILTAETRPGITYADVEAVTGGNFFSGLKNFGKKLINVARPIHDFVKDNRLISTTTGLIPHPGAQVASQVAKALGYGVMSGGAPTSGGVVLGGKPVTKKELMDRLRA